ncbi:MAG: hypothetical protein NWQ13_02625, partial [Glaciimonas sp.]|nr:hypothetical protein [Glaciimonas sp.]
AYFGKTFERTGVRDQLPAPLGKGRNYGHGFWQQQWLGLKRMVAFSGLPSAVKKVLNTRKADR